MTTGPGPSPLLDALVGAAVDATAAKRGWLLAASGDEQRVVAGHGDGATAAVGARGPAAHGWAGSVVATRRPVALAPQGDDPRFLGDLVLGTGHRPASLLCFPCPHGGLAVGALLLVDKAAGAPFSLDDVELITMLAEIAGAAVAETGGDTVAAAPRPDALGAELRRLAVSNPPRYATIAEVVGELLRGS